MGFHNYKFDYDGEWEVYAKDALVTDYREYIPQNRNALIQRAEEGEFGITTLPTGQISLSDVNAELGRNPTASINMDDSEVRALAGKSTGAVSMSDLRGKSRDTIYYPTHSWTYTSGAVLTTYYATATQYSNCIKVYLSSGSSSINLPTSKHGDCVASTAAVFYVQYSSGSGYTNKYSASESRTSAGTTNRTHGPITMGDHGSSKGTRYTRHAFYTGRTYTKCDKSGTTTIPFRLTASSSSLQYTVRNI